MGEEINVWYDDEGDYLEVLFAKKKGYFKETENDAIMEKVDEDGNIIGFSILKVRKFGKKRLGEMMMKRNNVRKERGGPSQDILDETVRRILTVVKPRRIVLFGSAARGTMGPDSDMDLLIVMPDGIHRRRTSVEIYKALRGIGLSKDVVVVTEQDVTKYHSNPSLVLKPALDEGREIYASA